MTPTIAQAILIAVAVLAVLFLIHRFAPAAKIAQAEHWAAAEVNKAPTVAEVKSFVEGEAMQALACIEMWLTDTTAQDAAIAKANTEKQTKAAALRAHIATLQAKLPAA
jgi:hypothetical protein